MALFFKDLEILFKACWYFLDKQIIFQNNCPFPSTISLATPLIISDVIDFILDFFSKDASTPACLWTPIALRIRIPNVDAKDENLLNHLNMILHLIVTWTSTASKMCLSKINLSGRPKSYGGGREICGGFATECEWGNEGNQISVNLDHFSTGLIFLVTPVASNEYCIYFIIKFTEKIGLRFLFQ